MDTKTHRVGPASVRIRKCNAVPLDMREGTREVACLQVPSRLQNRGYATTLMYKVCREADAAGIVLVLWPQPFGDHMALGRTQLAEWYAARFGFVEVQPEPLMMARQPGTTPKMLALNPVVEACVRGLA
jgi:N-acetylglutamate synthase-like GNAT family acetyltransferase